MASDVSVLWSQSFQLRAKHVPIPEKTTVIRCFLYALCLISPAHTHNSSTLHRHFPCVESGCGHRASPTEGQSLVRLPEQQQPTSRPLVGYGGKQRTARPWRAVGIWKMLPAVAVTAGPYPGLRHSAFKPQFPPERQPVAGHSIEQPAVSRSVPGEKSLWFRVWE